MLADEAKVQPWKADVVAAKRGDQSAFASLVRSTQRSIFGLCLRLLRSESEASEVAHGRGRDEGDSALQRQVSAGRRDRARGSLVTGERLGDSAGRGPRSAR